VLGSQKFPSLEKERKIQQWGGWALQPLGNIIQKNTTAYRRGNSNDIAPWFEYLRIRYLEAICSHPPPLILNISPAWKLQRLAAIHPLDSLGRKNILLHDLFPQMIFEPPRVPAPTVRYTPAVSLCAVTNTTKLRSAYHCCGLHCVGDLSRFEKKNSP